MQDYECPTCSFKGNTSEMFYNEKNHSLNCPDCGCAIIENYKENDGNWVTVADENVRIIWACTDPDCEGKKEETKVNPKWHQNNSAPVCEHCNTDMDYIRTEVKN